MITADVQHELDHFDRTMGQYVALTRRSAADVVAQKGGQIIMGNMSPPFPGLFQALRRLSPAEGTITRDRESVLRGTRRGLKRPVKVRHRARRRAKQLLEGRPSGLFKLSRSRGGVKVRQVRFRKRGNKRISSRSNRGGMVRISRRGDAGQGESLLNRVSLGIALELQMREAGRGYVAVSFLPKAYRRMIGRIRADVRRDEKAYRQRKIELNKALLQPMSNRHQDALMRNKSGEVLGRAEFRSTANNSGASLRITGFTPPQQRAEAHSIVGDVLRSVSADTQVYIDRKLAKQRQQVGKFGK